MLRDAYTASTRVSDAQFCPKLTLKSRGSSCTWVRAQDILVGPQHKRMLVRLTHWSLIVWEVVVLALLLQTRTPNRNVGSQFQKTQHFVQKVVLFQGQVQRTHWICFASKPNLNQLLHRARKKLQKIRREAPSLEKTRTSR